MNKVNAYLNSEDEDDDDYDIATVYSKEYLAATASFQHAAAVNKIGRNPLPSDICLTPNMEPNPSPTPTHETKAVEEEVDKAVKIIGYQQSSPSPIEPETPKRYLDLEWISFKNVVEPILLSTPQSMIVEDKLPQHPVTRALDASDTHQSVVAKPRILNFRWILVVVLAGVVLTTSVLAVGLSILHKKNMASEEASAVEANANNDKSPSTNNNVATIPQGTTTNRNPVSSPVMQPTTSEGANRPTTKDPVLATEQPVKEKEIATVTPTTYPLRQVVFAAIGDTPYDENQKSTLEEQLMQIDENNVDFVIHLGNIRNVNDNDRCKKADYVSAATIMQMSTVPVFVIVGDNDWTNCQNAEEAFGLWENNFLSYESQFWTPDFTITNQPNRVNNFSFEHNGVLFIGLTLLNESPFGDWNEWDLLLQEQYEWTTRLIEEYNAQMESYTGRVVLFGHASPDATHATFFEQLEEWMRVTLENSLPILYLNGIRPAGVGGTQDFNDIPSFFNIALNKEEAQSGPVIFRIEANGAPMSGSDAFVNDSGEGDVFVSEQKGGPNDRADSGNTDDSTDDN